MTETSLYARARVATESPTQLVRRWLWAGWHDFWAHLGLSLGYGIALVVIGWVLIWLMASSGLGWVLLPLLSAGALVGPVATVGLYAVARGRKGVAAPGQILLVGTILMVFALTWIRAATLLFAIVYGLRPFAGFLDVLVLMTSTASGWMLLIVGSCVGGLFAGLGFAVAAFSLPMLVDRPIDGFSAMGLSFNATTQNLRLAIVWGAVVTVLTGIGIVTGLLGLIVIFPLLGYATWHAYADLFKGQNDV